MAAFHEVFVRLGVVEAPDHGPHSGDGGGDILGHGGAALVAAHRVGVVPGHLLRHLGRGGVAVRLFTRRYGGGRWCLVDSLQQKGGFRIITRHFHVRSIDQVVLDERECVDMKVGVYFVISCCKLIYILVIEREKKGGFQLFELLATGRWAKYIIRQRERGG